MRKIIAGMFITADGVIEAPEKWNPPYYNQEMTAVVQGQMATCDTHLYGRRSYELFRDVFTGPKAEHIPHAPIMNQTPKILVSTTLKQPNWGPTTLISTDVADHLREIKDHRCSPASRWRRMPRPRRAQTRNARRTGEAATSRSAGADRGRDALRSWRGAGSWPYAVKTRIHVRAGM